MVVNKWDLMPQDDAESREGAIRVVRDRLHFMPYVPVCFTSALRCWGTDTLMQTSLELGRERGRRVPSNRLSFVLAGALADHEPPPVKGHGRQRLRIDGLRQVDVNPPTFLFTVNNPELVHFSYQRYLENRLRATFGFDHTHLRLVFRRKG